MQTYGQFSLVSALQALFVVYVIQTTSLFKSFICRVHNRLPFSINVWVGIIGDTWIGPFILPGPLTGAFPCDFLINNLNVLLEEVPLDIIQRMWFTHDGAPPHFALAARAILHQRFPNKWIGRQGTTQWPARSPDLNPLNFYLWGPLKAIVYSTPIHNVEILRLSIE